MSKQLMIFFFFFISLPFSPPAQAHYLDFEQRIFDALDLIQKSIEKENLSLYYQSASVLRSAALVSNSDRAKSELEEAMSSILTTHNFDVPGAQASISKSHIQMALKYHRDMVGLNLAGEVKFMENLIKSHLFPEMDPKDINISFEGPKQFTRKLGLTLMASFIHDPRSVKYDDQICQIITGKTLEGDEAKLKVVFSNNVLTTTSIRDEAKGLRDLMNALLNESIKEENHIAPIKMKYKIIQGKYLLYFEVQGYKYAPLLRISHTTFALLANDSTTYRLIRSLEEFSFYLSHIDVPFDSQAIKGAFNTLATAVNTGRAGLIKQRDIAAQIHQKFFKNNTGEKIIERYAAKVDDAIIELEKDLAELNKGGTVVEGTAGARGKLLELSLPETTPRTSFGPEGDGSKRILSRQEIIVEKIKNLKIEKEKTLARMKDALSKLREGGVEIDVYKNAQGRWMRSSFNQILSVNEYKDYLSQEISDLDKSKQVWENKIQTRLQTELANLEKQKARALEIENELYKKDLLKEGQEIANQTHQERVRIINEGIEQKVKLAQERPVNSRWNRYWKKWYENKLGPLRESLETAEAKALIRAENLQAIPENVRNAREALVVAKSSGPFYKKFGMISMNADRGLFLISAFMTGVYLFQWQMAASRAENAEEKFLIWENYGPKIWHMAVYCIPLLQEGAFVVDLTYWSWNLVMNRDLDKFNGTELLLRQLFSVGQWLGYKWGGVTAWEVAQNDLNSIYTIPYFQLYEDAKIGKYYGDRLTKNYLNNLRDYVSGTFIMSENSENLEMPNIDLSTKEKKEQWLMQSRLNYIRQIQWQNRRYLSLMLEMNYEMDKKFPEEIESWILEQDKLIFGEYGQSKAVRRAIEWNQAMALELEKQ